MSLDPRLLDLAQSTLSLLSILLAAVLALRIHLQGLRRTYPFFFAYLIAEVLRGVVLLAIRALATGADRTIYAWAFVLSEPIIWIFYFLIVWELYSIVLRNHPGIAAAGRRALLFSMLAALALVAITLRTDLSNAAQRFPVLLLVHVAGRAVTSTLGLFLLLVSAILVWFPIPLNRNTVYYCLGYAAFFCSKAVFLLVRNVLGPSVVKPVSLAILAVATGALLYWLVKLSPAGETVPMVVRKPADPEETERLLRQLSAVNDTFSRVLGKR